jgi:hypothetical protein
MKRGSASPLLAAAGSLALLVACQTAPLRQRQAQAQPRSAAPAAAHSNEAERQLAEAKPRLMSADYRADLADLARLREQVTALADDPAIGYLAHYWAGFASWRLAINGASHGMSADDIKAHLERAAVDFEASIRLRDDFADGYAAAASVNGWLTGINKDDAAVMREHLALARSRLARAKELAPANPRVLWVEGGALYFAPAAYGGSQERGMEVWRRAAELGEAAAAAGALGPDWGQPEALMSLAFGHLNQATPDLAAASEEAHAALRLRPEWSYVRDILLPQIEARRRQN